MHSSAEPVGTDRSHFDPVGNLSADSPLGRTAADGFAWTFSDVLLADMFRCLQCVQQLQKQTLAVEEAKLRIRQAYLRQLEQSSLHPRRIRHDLNTHLQTISLLHGGWEVGTGWGVCGETDEGDMDGAIWKGEGINAPYSSL